MTPPAFISHQRPESSKKKKKNSSSFNAEKEPNELVIHLHELRASAGKEITLFMSLQVPFSSLTGMRR